MRDNICINVHTLTYNIMCVIGLAGYNPRQVAAAVTRALQEFDDVSANGNRHDVHLKTIKFFDINRDVVNALRDEFKMRLTPKNSASGGATGYSMPSTPHGSNGLSATSSTSRGAAGFSKPSTVQRNGQQDDNDDDSSLPPPTCTWLRCLQHILQDS